MPLAAIFLICTPYSFLFFLVYLLTLFFLLSVFDFYLFWFLMELCMLLFMGLRYRVFSTGFSSLIVYFLVQTLASFSILVCYTFSYFRFFLFFVLLKLSMFPFHSWFLSVVYSFPSLPLFLVSSFHKLPSFLLVALFSCSRVTNALFLSCFISLVLSGRFMLSTADLRFLLLSSSIGNNSWFVLSCLHSSLLLVAFLCVYSFFLYLVLGFLGSLSSLKATVKGPASLMIFTTYVMALSGLPPFPVFWFKLALVFLCSSLLSSFFMFLFLLAAMLVLRGYVKFCLDLLTIRSSFYFWAG